MRILYFIIFVVFCFSNPSFAQEGTDETLVKPAPEDSKKADSGPVNATPAQTTDLTGNEKVAVIPNASDDARTEKTLNSLASQAGWFPELKISVKNGIVTIKGRTKDSQHLEWLAKTADRLPTVIAVINQAQLETPPVTDLTPTWNEFKRLVEKSKRAVPRVVLALLMLSLFFFLGRRISKGIYSLWSRSVKNQFLLSTVARLTMLPIWVLFFYLALQAAGLSSLATTIIGGTGAVGIVLGFAFKDIAENYLSGILLAIRAPFTKGDQIQVNEYQGFVQSLNMRGTTILDFDGNLILIPNTMVIQSVIRNRSVNTKNRGAFTVGIGYTDSISKAQEIIQNVLKAIPDILSDPQATVVVDKFSPTTVDLSISFWFDVKKSSVDSIRTRALSQIKEGLLAQGFSLPDPTREIIVGDEIKVRFLEGPAGVSADQNRQERITQGAQARFQECQTLSSENVPTHEEQMKKLGEHSDLLNRSSQDGLPIT